MSVDGDEPNARAPAERNVECYLVAKGIDLSNVPDIHLNVLSSFRGNFTYRSPSERLPQPEIDLRRHVADQWDAVIKTQRSQRRVDPHPHPDRGVQWIGIDCVQVIPHIARIKEQRPTDEVVKRKPQLDVVDEQHIASMGVGQFVVKGSQRTVSVPSNRR